MLKYLNVPTFSPNFTQSFWHHWLCWNSIARHQTSAKSEIISNMLFVVSFPPDLDYYDRCWWPRPDDLLKVPEQDVIIIASGECLATWASFPGSESGCRWWMHSILWMIYRNGKLIRLDNMTSNRTIIYGKVLIRLINNHLVGC